jgi:DNA-binding response OmpR family regulator
MKEFTLLYAEDEYTTRRDHIVFLQSRFNCKIYEANNGKEALKLYKKYHPHIVLTDITMPQMTGLELAQEIRKISKETKIIITTAHSQKEKLLEALTLNMVNYLLKPLKRKDLIQSIDTALQTLTLAKEKENFLYFDKDTKYNLDTQEYYTNNSLVILTLYETKLLNFLCQNKNRAVSSFDIFVSVWEDVEKEYNASSVRTLIKKLRKKLPENSLLNIYGGLYKLQISS